MPIVMEPRENGRVLLIRVSDPWTIDDLDQLFDQIRQCVEHCDHPVYSLIDMTLARGIPPRFLIRLQQEPLLTHPNFGGAVFANAGSVMQALFDVATSIFHLKPAVFFRSEAEAWTHLRAEIGHLDNGQPLTGTV